MNTTRNLTRAIAAALFLLAGACNPSPGGKQQGVRQESDSLSAAATEAGGPVVSAQTRIVSLNGTISEILVALGMEENIVGTDVTSTYPTSVLEKPKVGHNRNISAEGVLSLQPDLVLARAGELNPELISQFETAGVRVVSYVQEYSIEGTRKLIREVAQSLGQSAKADLLITRLNNGLDSAARYVNNANVPKVLFIYARGTGTMMVAGENTQVGQMIELAGGQNAVKGFEDFKPLTAESLVAANPDVILLFDSGLESLGGMEGLLEIRGIAQTNAGKNKKVIEMDGQLLTGFGPRLGQAIAELAQGLR